MRAVVMQCRYSPELGDVVIGRVSEVSQHYAPISKHYLTYYACCVTITTCCTCILKCTYAQTLFTPVQLNHVFQLHVRQLLDIQLVDR